MISFKFSTLHNGKGTILVQTSRYETFALCIIDSASDVGPVGIYYTRKIHYDRFSEMLGVGLVRTTPTGKSFQGRQANMEDRQN